ncbi:MAG: TonB-dependent receptor [Acidobacteria bacterium]|nr:TonB-dependent receptor [Acidobacteriota bacterium]
MKNRFRSLALAALMLSLLAISAFAQVTGRINGTVTDQAGAAVPGASIELMLPGGSRAVINAVTTSEGLFNLAGVPAGAYELVIIAQGYKKRVIQEVIVRPNQELALSTFQLEVGQLSETVQVTESQSVQTSNAEVSLNITKNQIRELPVLGRSPQAFVTTQAGVGNGRGSATINGQRTSFTNVTLDGINIQDNFIRTNAVDFSPNVLLLDQVAEVTLTTSNSSSLAGGGASQISFVTPSGTNQFHGSGYWQNRNSAVAANTWFNNRDGIAKPFLNANWIGATIGGPVIKDKLLFYFNYEAYRLRQQTAANRAILTADARNGIFTYQDGTGAVKKVNILQTLGLSADPATAAIIAKIPTPDKINNYRTGDSSETLLRNTAGYSFNIQNNRTQDHYTAKVDYNLSTKHAIQGSYVFNSDIIDRPDQSNDYDTKPKVINDDISKLFSVGWRWNPTSKFTNELRGGFNIAPVIFATSEQFGSSIIGIAGGLFGNPLNTFRLQGRNPRTYNLFDNASYVMGKHTLQFGYYSQRVYVENYNEGGITPTVTLGIGTGNQGLTTQLPGASSTDLTAANNLLANLAGYYTSYTQTFNVKDRTAGFVKGALTRRNLTFHNYAGYLTDSWKVKPRLTATLGLRYDYFTPVDEVDGLALLPVLNGTVLNTLRSNSTLDFAGNAVNRPFYSSDRNNFAPNIGLAWDLFGNGKTALRAGYSVNHVNDEFVIALNAYVGGNAGLAQTVTGSGLTGRLTANGAPTINTPAFKVPRTFQDNNLLNSSTNFSIPDPNLRTPYVQQWNIGIQHEWHKIVFDARYVGNHGVKLLRGIDQNQVLVSPEFLADFRRAQSNGNLSRAATGVFNPAYNAAIAGSQQLTVLPLLPTGGQLTNTTIRTLIDQGQVGELASNYQVTRTNGTVNFFPNPFGLATNVLSNYSHSQYNALQMDMRGRLRDLTFQVNYTWSKVLSDAAAGSENAFQNRNEAFLDFANPRIERARAPFDLSHVIKGNFVYQLPAGKGHWFNFKPLERALSGWQISSIFIKESGAPFSVLSGRGTLNRSGQSGTNTASSSLTNAQLFEGFQVRIASNGPYFVPASWLGSDGRAVAADGSAAFNGQVFSQPGAGTLGQLQRRMFSAPWVFNADFALSKTTKIKEGHTLVLRMESTNIFNHPTWSVGDQTVTSTSFGRITGTFFGRRVIQFSLHYRF